MSEPKKIYQLSVENQQIFSPLVTSSWLFITLKRRVNEPQHSSA
jgi:hypothetical protein